MWIIFGFISAFLLGTYDIFKKLSLDKNAVIPVLWASVTFSSLLLLPFLLISRIEPSLLKETIFFVPELDFRTHMLILLKSTIVLCSWIFAYFAMKHLPLSVVSPIRATQPIWTVLGGVLILGERLNFYQGVGVGITLISFFLFSMAGKKEGISFRSNKWIWFIILATLFGTFSALYDKYLLRQFDHMTVLVYYTLYQALIMGFIALFMWYPKRKQSTPFQFRWSILFISVFLISSDFIYFYALTFPDSLISVLSPIRRSGVIVPFLFGIMVMHDRNAKLKSVCLAGVLLGILFLFLGS